ncbi:MAG: hypothetical protein AAGD14_12265 [Planctomycetota bacterium]
MSIKFKRVRYLGSKWVLFFWTILFFPVAVLLFVLDAVWIEHEATPEELNALDSRP